MRAANLETVANVEKRTVLKEPNNSASHGNANFRNQDNFIHCAKRIRVNRKGSTNETEGA
jgi:hypothetical protein